MKVKMKKSAFATLFLLFLVAVSFQNCGKGPYQSAFVSELSDLPETKNNEDQKIISLYTVYEELFDGVGAEQVCRGAENPARLTSAQLQILEQHRNNGKVKNEYSVGDAIDTVVIQEAIEQAKAGDTVWFPNAGCVIFRKNNLSATDYRQQYAHPTNLGFYPKSGITLKGNGTTLVAKDFIDARKVENLSRSAWELSWGWPRGVHDLTIEGFIFDNIVLSIVGQTPGYQYKEPVVIDGKLMPPSGIKGNEFGTYNIKIKNNYFLNGILDHQADLVNGQEVPYDRRIVYERDTRFEYHPYVPQLKIVYALNVEVEGNHFERSTYDQQGSSVVINSSWDINLKNNTWNGYYVTAVNVGGVYWDAVAQKAVEDYRSKNIRLTDNTISRTLGAYTQDQAVYIINFYDVFMSRNYVKGWSLSDTGCALKLRNGENATVFNNYFENSGVCLYVYDSTPYTFLKNLKIESNTVDLQETGPFWPAPNSPTEPYVRTARYGISFAREGFIQGLSTGDCSPTGENPCWPIPLKSEERFEIYNNTLLSAGFFFYQFSDMNELRWSKDGEANNNTSSLSDCSRVLEFNQLPESRACPKKQ